jgi:hypothetical protein
VNADQYRLMNAAKKRRQRERKRQGLPPRTISEAIRERQEQQRQAEVADRGPLFHRMVAEAVGGVAFEDLTVLALVNDPYRLDTSANHALGQWFGDQVAQALPYGIGTVHLRGLHYRLVAAGNVIKPNGEVYRNTDADSYWLGERASKAARWLGYVDFARIVDERNAPPEVYCEIARDASPPAVLIDQGCGIGREIETGGLLPSLAAAMPDLHCSVPLPQQPYRIVLIGEKVSLKPILLPIAERIKAELILPTGELSDTLLYGMVNRAADDGRPAVVLYFSDFDPSGYHMPVSVARKLQALCDLRFPDLDIAVYPVALSFEQVRDLDLPSTPLKETVKEKKKGKKWIAHWGREQTEIDALAALRPAELRRIAEEAIRPFYDPTLYGRHFAAGRDWQTAADELLQAHPAYEETREALGAILDGADTQIGELRDQLEAALQAAADELDAAQTAGIEKLKIDLPVPYEQAAPEITATAPDPLYSSRADWRRATERLIAYRDLGDLGGDLDEEPTE